MQSSMKDVNCSQGGCGNFVVFQHIQFTATRPHVTSYCQKHKDEHDRAVVVSQELQHMPAKQPAPRSPEDVMADSALFILERLRELKTQDAAKALIRVKKALE